MTTTAPHVLTTEEVGRRFDEGGFAAATVNLHEWTHGGTVDASHLVAEMRYWLDYMGGAK